jgi:hypothetical protein
MEPNMIGAYAPSGEAVLVDRPAALSFRNARFADVEEWRTEARAKAREILAPTDLGGTPKPKVFGDNG